MDRTRRTIRHRRIRTRIKGNARRPRASITRSLTRVSVQLIDDTTHHTLVSAIGLPAKVGKEIAAAAKKQGIDHIVFDRGGYKYHGRIKAVAEAMREAGLVF